MIRLRRPFPWCVVAAAAWAAANACAQSGEPSLKLSRELLQNLPKETEGLEPSFVEADRIEGRVDRDVSLQGNASIRKHHTVIRADRIDYSFVTDEAKARGKVRVIRNGNIFEGTALDLKVDAFEGSLQQPSYSFLRTQSHGQASRIDFIDADRAVARDATLTSCRKEGGPSWVPDWVLSATQIKLDNASEEGEARDAVLRFKNLPVLAVPYLSFPIGGKRKSGFLPPSINLSNVSGFEYAQPYYWNIAPHRDATFTPTLMTKRGLDLGLEFRYLEREQAGRVIGNWMPADGLRDRSRWGYHFRHTGGLASASLGPVRFSADISRVSDDNYWRDFPRAGVALTQRLLPTDLQASKSFGDWSLQARTLKWQTLQDPASPITPPYDRLPQIVARYSRSWNNDAWGLEWVNDFTRFDADKSLTNQVNAQRLVSVAAIRRQWATPGYFVLPKLQLHASQYRFDAPLADGRRGASRMVPTFSVDSGLFFERDLRLGRVNYVQTLEPRAFFTYTPWRNQNGLPNYDSGANDFNFATIFSENAFSGNDRIADNRSVTLGASSRLLNPETGIEAARLTFAQRIRLRDQNVTLPGGSAQTERASDMLLGAMFAMSRRWTWDATVQYSPDVNRSVRSTIAARYSPGAYRTLNAAYRLARGQSEQLDVSWQWPLNWGRRAGVAGEPSTAQRALEGLGEGRWYTVGRFNYSLADSKPIDTLIGLEYDGGCWLSRVVFESTRRGVGQVTPNKRILFQLEFVGFTRLGNNPLSALQRSIPRYQLLRERVATPSRFSSYE